MTYPYDSSPTIYSDIYEIQRNQAAQLRIAEFNERSNSIARETGARPVGYFEYERKHPTERERSKFGFLVGGFIGALFGGLLGSIPAEKKLGLKGAGVGAVIGGALGALTNESPGTRLNRSLDKYAIYINNFEESAHAAKITHSTISATPKGHAESILAERRDASTAPALS